MVTLPFELIVFEILTWVAPKVVGRCRSVYKSWYSVLSSRVFVKEHISRSLTWSNQKVMLINDQNCRVYPINLISLEYGTSIILNIPFSDNVNGLRILTHWNGILCVSMEQSSEIFLWNPVTNAFKLLINPVSNELFYVDDHDAVGMYIDNQDDLKVLYLRRRNDVISVYVYSRSQSSWRKIRLDFERDTLGRNFYWSSGTFCDNSLYFIVNERLAEGRQFLIRFDIILEKFWDLSLPDFGKHVFTDIVLVNVNNKLHMFIAYGNMDLTISSWILDGNHDDNYWDDQFSCPPLHMDEWKSISHYVTNGTWFVMNQDHIIYEIQVGSKPFDCFYPVTWFRDFKGALYTETIESPHI